MARTVLIVDDDPVQRRLAETMLVKFGYTVLQAVGGTDALTLMEGPSSGTIDLVLLDLAMPDLDGMGVLSALRERGIDVPVVVLTATGGMDTVIAAMRAGAFDFVVKPVSPERLKTSIANALKVEALEDRVKRGGKRSGAVKFKDILTRSPSMERVLDLSRKAAGSNIPIMIEGESGVGKELVARAIKSACDRSGKPFVTVNCGAIPENLVESILFGHEKGAFTGAVDKHVGKFVEANGGTLFLDEVGDLPLDIQVKLLRAVQEGEVDPVGAKHPQKVDIRIISATHRDLVQRVRDGLFRVDLFYRLNVFPIRVPPLRERRMDIEPLVRHFIGRFAAEATGSGVTGIAPDTLTMLSAYDWPGNVRQLENAVFRAVVLCEGSELTMEEFPQIRAQVEGIDALRLPEASFDDDVLDGAGSEPVVAQAPVELVSNGLDSGQTTSEPDLDADKKLRVLDARGDVRPLTDIERDMICLAIDHYGGQMSEVARRLGIGRSTLYRKLKEFGIDHEAGRDEKLAS